ncbi:MAG: 16S rRNA (guanine(527)-N(7))-methyltransferase RsmG [Acidobacteria bacterium]|nr:16S rRNA (guanine(527)-N(7))-methyltransferase RsmG [Acidobacteriota bacterium]
MAKSSDRISRAKVRPASGKVVETHPSPLGVSRLQQTVPDQQPLVKIAPRWIQGQGRFFRLALSDEQCGQILSYLELLKKWNRKINLTGIRSDSEAIRLHFLESLFAAEQLPAGNLRIVDVGSGAGFPGLAMKIARPGLRMVLLDSRKKKVLFQREVIRHLRMQHVAVYPLRLKEAAFFLQQADVVCWRGLKLEGKDFDFLQVNTSNQCLYLCFQGSGDRTERSLHGCEIEKIPIPLSEHRTLLLAHKKFS